MPAIVLLAAHKSELRVSLEMLVAPVEQVWDDPGLRFSARAESSVAPRRASSVHDVLVLPRLASYGRYGREALG
ncbi:MAG: hypothetical protein WAN22_30270 [Solirubrobacteraceae bacterium]